MATLMNTEESENESSSVPSNEHEEDVRESNEGFEEEYPSEDTSVDEKTSFLPVYRVRMKFHSIPIIISILVAGALAWYISSLYDFSDIIPEENPTQGSIAIRVLIKKVYIVRTFSMFFRTFNTSQISFNCVVIIF